MIRRVAVFRFVPEPTETLRISPRVKASLATVDVELPEAS